MAVIQVLDYRRGEIFKNALNVDFRNESQSSPSDELIGAQKILPESVASQSHLVLHTPVKVQLVHCLPVEEEELFETVVLMHLQVCEDGHHHLWKVLIVVDHSN